MSEPRKESGSARELYTPQPVQARVIERHLDGASNRQIAREESLDRETVNRILSQRELVEMRAEQQSQLQRLVSKALKVYEEALDSQDIRLAAATATKILEGTAVLDGKGLQATIDDAIQREVMRKTPLLPEFQQGPQGFVRRKTKGKPVIRTELQVVSDRSLDGQNRTNNDAVPVSGTESGER